MLASALDHPQRPQPGHLERQASTVHDVDHHIDVLVGSGLLFSEAFTAAAFGDDALSSQFFWDVAATGGPGGRPSG